jgi:hypothetical protein
MEAWTLKKTKIVLALFSQIPTFLLMNKTNSGRFFILSVNSCAWAKVATENQLRESWKNRHLVSLPLKGMVRTQIRELAQTLRELRDISNFVI